MFKDRLLKLRKLNKLTQEELANMLNVSKQTVGSWERGRTEPAIEAINELATILNTTTDYLIGRTDILETDKSPEITKLLHEQMTNENNDYTELFSKLSKLDKSQLSAIENLIDTITKKET